MIQFIKINFLMELPQLVFNRFVLRVPTTVRRNQDLWKSRVQLIIQPATKWARGQVKPATNTEAVQMQNGAGPRIPEQQTQMIPASTLRRWGFLRHKITFSFCPPNKKFIFTPPIKNCSGIGWMDGWICIYLYPLTSKRKWFTVVRCRYSLGQHFFFKCELSCQITKMNSQQHSKDQCSALTCLGDGGGGVSSVTMESVMILSHYL